MNNKLQRLMNNQSFETHFDWNEDEKTWCLYGTDSGNAWETDDYPAANQKEAEQDAADYLEAWQNRD